MLTISRSMRRFFERPSVVLLLARGCSSPFPLAESRLAVTPPTVERNPTTLWARAAESSRLRLLLPRASVDPTTISTINLATNALIPAPVATPLAIILYELVDNALKHAFTDESAANFIQISLELKPATSSAADTLTVVVQDDGIGLPSRVNVHAAQSKGFGVINALCSRLGGKLDVGLDSGTIISVCLPLDEDTMRSSS